MIRLASADGLDVDPASRAIETHLAINQSKNGVVATKSDVLARQKLCPARANDDVASHDQLAPKLFHAQSLADAVAAVLDAALTFFMSHDLFLGFRCLFWLGSFPAKADASNFHACEFAPVTDGAVITFAAAIFESDDFLVLALFENFAFNGRALDQRRAVSDVVAIRMKEHIGENSVLARLGLEEIDIDDVTFRDAVLPATSFDNCERHKRKRVSRGKAAHIHTDMLF